VVDLHAITVWQEPTEPAARDPRSDRRLIAAARSKKKHIVFNQSQVPSSRARLDLPTAWPAWLAQPHDPIQREGRKDREMRPSASYSYPTLMRPHSGLSRHHVPVGEDQKQHLSCRATSPRVQQRLGASIRATATARPSFRSRAADPGPATRVMSLRDGTKKMSKSDASTIRGSI